MEHPKPSAPHHCVIIPSYNSGALLQPTLRSALRHWPHVLLVVDGSNDGSDSGAEAIAEGEASLQILRLTQNHGKGGAVLEGLCLALTQGFTHAIIFDSDGQHESADIPKMIAASNKYPEAMILGVPIFGEDAPTLRVKGRQAGNWWTNFETLWGGIEDSLFGFRLYPIEESIAVLSSIRGGKRFDFETQLAVRLYWRGIPAVSFPSRVTYPQKEEGGVSHFKYLRDNILLVHTHLRICCASETPTKPTGHDRGFPPNPASNQ
jgi:glycosyltransferase involved in cell wall biosynthesis